MSAASAVRHPDGAVTIMFPYRQWTVESIKARIPGPYRTYDPEWRTWTISGPWTRVAIEILETAYDNVQLIDETGDIPREVDRFGADPFAALHLRPSMPPEIITIVYRELAKLHHPDRGGDVIAMQRINHAFDELRDRGLVAGGGR